MSKARRGTPRLGKGLSHLVGRADQQVPVTPAQPSASPARLADPQAASPPAERQPQGESLQYLPVEAVVPNPQQPRQHFDEAALQSLADSIRSAGLMQPIVVRPVKADGDAPRYQLVAGERRWRAAQMAELTALPAVVRELSDQQVAQWALIENLQREDLNAMDRAEAFDQLATRFGLSHEQIAEQIGIDRSSVTNTLRLLNLAPQVRQMVRRGALSFGQAKALAGIADEARQAALAQRAVDEAMSVRALEQAVREEAEQGGKKGDQAQRPAKAPAQRGAHFSDLEQQIGEELGTKIRIKPGRKKGSGTMTIEFYSVDQFDTLMERLGVKLESD